MADTVLITDPAAVKTIEKYADEKGISKAEAGARLVATAKGRLNAVRKYAAEHPAKPKAKKEKKAPAKKPAKPKAKKAPKAKKPEPENEKIEIITQDDVADEAAAQ